MNTSMKEQLQKIRCEIGSSFETEAPFTNEVQVKRWVVWRKNGQDYRKVCYYDSHGENHGKVVLL